MDGGINLFAYVLNDPVNWVDPLGLFWGPIGYGGAIVGAVGGGMLLAGTAPVWATGLLIVGGVAVIYDTYTSLVDYPKQVAEDVKNDILDPYYDKLGEAAKPCR